jgi:hypothetical protein
MKACYGWRNGFDGKVLRYGAGERHQHCSINFPLKFLVYSLQRYSTGIVAWPYDLWHYRQGA